MYTQLYAVSYSNYQTLVPVLLVMIEIPKLRFSTIVWLNAKCTVFDFERRYFLDTSLVIALNAIINAIFSKYLEIA